MYGSVHFDDEKLVHKVFIDEMQKISKVENH